MTDKPRKRMGRPPLSDKRKQINLRIPESLVRLIDEARGKLPRNSWHLDAIKEKLKKEGQ